jgi:hypothetical protein
MKKVVLFALLAAAAVSASAESFAGPGGPFYGPDRGAVYQCDYSNYSGSAKNGGRSWWELTVFTAADGRPMLRGPEHFEAIDRYGNGFWEGYKATWSAPRGVSHTYGSTTWDYTFNPYGPQCKSARVDYFGYLLTFSQCGDGHSRTCVRLYW